MPEPVEIRPLDAASAGELVACVRRCYGETYPEPEFLDPEALVRELRADRLRSWVALTRAGRVVGNVGLRFAVAGDCVADTVAGFVDPDHRGRGLLRQLGAAMVRELRERGIAGIRSYATTAHAGTQHLLAAGGGRVTGLLLGHIPAGTEYRGIGHAFGAARIGAVAFYQALGPAPPLAVYPPGPWRDPLLGLYADLGFERHPGSAEAAAEPMARLRLDPHRGVACIRVGAGSRPLGERVEEVSRPDVEVAYVDVPLAERVAASGAVEGLARAGFVFGALLPGSRASETLRLQRVAPGCIAPERLQLASPDAAALRDRILEEMGPGS